MNINENTSGVFRWLVPVSKDLGGGTLSTKCHSSFECVNAPEEHFEFCSRLYLLSQVELTCQERKKKPSSMHLCLMLLFLLNNRTYTKLRAKQKVTSVFCCPSFNHIPLFLTE